MTTYQVSLIIYFFSLSVLGLHQSIIDIFDPLSIVKTGKYRDGDERRANAVPPDEVFDSFASFIDNLLAG